MRLTETAFAKLNLALHVRGRRADGRHEIETLFAFCDAGDTLEGRDSDRLTLNVSGPFAGDLDAGEGNLVWRAAVALADVAGVTARAALTLTKNLPVASGIGGGSADAAAALRLLTRLWRIDPAHAAAVAQGLGSDVPACVPSLSARGEGAGDRLQAVDAGVDGMPVLLVNPGIPLSTGAVFARWDGVDRGPLGDWREGRNDLYLAARSIAPRIATVMRWMDVLVDCRFARMSGSGPTCFALFDTDADRDAAAAAVPDGWWRMAARLR